MRDEHLKERIQDVYTSNFRVYGARKIWRELNRQGHAVARCTVERLMRELGIQGAVRGKRVITTLPGGQTERAPAGPGAGLIAFSPGGGRGTVGRPSGAVQLRSWAAIASRSMRDQTCAIRPAWNR